MENSLLAIFDEIWPETMYYSTGTLTQFLSNFKKFVKNTILIGISSNFLGNISTCIKCTTMIDAQHNTGTKFNIPRL